MKPLIGITAGMTKESGGLFSNCKKDYLNSAYSRAVAQAGGIPVIIPINPDPEVIRATLGRLDGLILSGGDDASPLVFGEEPMPRLGFVYPERDYAELEILNQAMALKLPILAICRGCQFLNSALGGSLYQDLAYFKPDCLMHVQNAYPDEVTHSIEIQENSLLKEIFGDHTLVNSFHHQLINEPAPNFKVTARARDGAIEGIEYQGRDHFIMGLQFHPELLAEKYDYCQRVFDRYVVEVNKTAQTE